MVVVFVFVFVFECVVRTKVEGVLVERNVEVSCGLDGDALRYLSGRSRDDVASAFAQNE